MNEADYVYENGMDASDYDEYLNVMNSINSSIFGKLKITIKNILTYFQK
jgi:hypothetical protein